MGRSKTTPFRQLNTAYTYYHTRIKEKRYWSNRWLEYLLTHNKMSGQMVDEGVYRHWVFHREVDPPHTSQDWNPAATAFDPDHLDEFGATPLMYINDIYVKPEDFTHIFANTQGLDNFQTFYRHECNVFQPISHRFLSY